ncbi:MAG: hypothetical protein A4E49_03444 [Methanosaeta sp. PtaU1.Bin112]|nr:MAG: hypothetical protein A4E49_03444 [Methanosaeta sp. PtaU1.Bin112]
MACSDASEDTTTQIRLTGVSLVSIDEMLSALSPSERKNLLESVAYHKDMLEELAKM